HRREQRNRCPAGPPGQRGPGIRRGTRAPEGLRSRVIGHDTLVVVVRPDHPWARRRQPLSPAELAATALVSREEGRRPAAGRSPRPAGAHHPPTPLSGRPSPRSPARHATIPHPVLLGVDLTA